MSDQEWTRGTRNFSTYSDLDEQEVCVSPQQVGNVLGIQVAIGLDHVFIPEDVCRSVLSMADFFYPKKSTKKKRATAVPAGGGAFTK